MKSLSKISLVVAGYVLAFVVASIVVGIYIAATNGPDRQTYGAMYDFGDSILFLAVLGLAAVPATGMTLFFLRPYRTFWRIVSIGALAIAMTGVAALAVYLVHPTAASGAFLWTLEEVSPLRFFLAPLLALASFLCVLFAPTRSSRIAFLCASAIESVVFVWIALIWFHPFW